MKANIEEKTKELVSEESSSEVKVKVCIFSYTGKGIKS